MSAQLSISTMHGSLLLAVTLIFLLAGLVKGIVGLGLPTVAVGLLGLYMSPLQAAALLIMPSLVTNLWQLLAGGRFVWLLRRLWLMLAGIVAGTLLGAQLVPVIHDGGATLILGLALMGYAVVGLSAVKFSVPPERERRWSLMIGVVTGVITATTAVLVIPAVPFLQALRLNKDELIQALGLSFTISTLAMAAALAHGGTLQSTDAMLSILALVPALAGMLLGQCLRARISASVFRRCFFIGLLLLGMDLFIQGWR